MRTVTYGAACSLDGFITGPNESIDWLHYSKDVAQIMTEYWADVDTILMGRRTWDFAVRSGAGSDGGGRVSDIKTYVFSRTLGSIDAPGATLVRDDAADFVRRLKQQPGKNICLMGGSDFARTLLAAGLVDEVGANIHPILLGDGVPLFSASPRTSLELASCRSLDGGCVYVRYKVATSLPT